MSAKGWGDVLVDGLEEIQWQEDIFERLVLPEKRKMMVKALVRHSSDSFQDLVQGKGEGTLFLLYGELSQFTTKKNLYLARQMFSR